jgi:hypothetical protein
MRSLALAILGLLAASVAASVAACDGNSPSGDGACVFNGTRYALGEVFPAGDNCNSCECTASGAVCTEVTCLNDAGVDATPTACGPSGGCPQGPVCGVLCCKSGERCVSGTCRCGNGSACGTNDTCEAAGPVGNDQCGFVCCGASGPCPQ